jgi:hypothetical protein
VVAAGLCQQPDQRAGADSRQEADSGLLSLLRRPRLFYSTTGCSP